MNSAEDLQQNVNDLQESHTLPAPESSDNNANKALSRTDKKKTSVKLNNNIENMSTMNSTDESHRFNGLYAVNYLIEPSCSNQSTSQSNECTSDTETVEYDTDAETECMSGSEDGCIYTYKGDHVADLPNSFFLLGPEAPEAENPAQNEAQNRQEASSPEMDFLEMDFDPSNNGDNDSLSENEFELTVDPSETIVKCPERPENQNGEIIDPGEGPSHPINGESSPAEQESRERYERTRKDHNFVNEEKIGGQIVDSSMERMSEKQQNIKQRRLIHEEFISNGIIEPAMVWSAEEALLKESSMNGGTNCAVTAVFNVLTALRIPISSVERIASHIQWRRYVRSYTLPTYLMSRSQAGSTHHDIMKGLREVSDGEVDARFFPMYPRRSMNLNTWLAFWIKNGVVPIVTLNLEMEVGPIGHAWHHQMIYGVDEDGVYLTNPYNYVETKVIWSQLSAESVVKVHRADVLSRWNFKTDLMDLMRIDDVRWQQINVVGQVANIIHENNRPLRQGLSNTSYIRIPTAYAAGITLTANVNSPGWHLLKEAGELPILANQNSADDVECAPSRLPAEK